MNRAVIIGNLFQVMPPYRGQLLMTPNEARERLVSSHAPV